MVRGEKVLGSALAQQVLRTRVAVIAESLNLAMKHRRKLDKKKVAEARREELKYFEAMGVN